MDLCFGRSGVWKWRLTTRTSSAVPRNCVKRAWHWGTWRTLRQRQRPLQSAAAWRGRTGWVVRYTAVWYSRVCLSATAVCSLVLQEEPCTAVWYSRVCVSATAVCSLVLQEEPCTAKCYSRLCEVPLLSVCSACGNLHCYVLQQAVWSATAVCSLVPAGGTQDVSVLTKQPSLPPFNQTNTAFHKTFCSRTPFCFRKIATDPHILANVNIISGWN